MKRIQGIYLLGQNQGTQWDFLTSNLFREKGKETTVLQLTILCTI